jgi:hypothetical protein
MPYAATMGVIVAVMMVVVFVGILGPVMVMAVRVPRIVLVRMVVTPACPVVME